MASARVKRFASRSTTGCLTCRMRRKKCDERKPDCLGCERNQLMCSWAAANEGPVRRSESWRKLIASGSRYQTSFGSTCYATEESSMSELIVDAPYYKARTPFSGPQTEGLALLSPSSPWAGRFLAGNASTTLLGHFVQVSAQQLSGRVRPENPFLIHFIPLAYSHDHVLQALLAVSGGHLYYSLPRFEGATRSHYAVALRSVKHSLSGWTSRAPADIVALLAAITLLCIFEVVIGNTDGALFYHLRASRELLLHLRKQPLLSSLAHDLDFLAEQYAFLAICANITLRTDFPLDRSVPLDGLVRSLENLNCNTASYGVMFGHAHQLFGVIPRIMQSARQTLVDGIDCDIAIKKSLYERQILDWHPERRPSPPSGFELQKGVPLTGDLLAEMDTDSQVMGLIYQQALLIFLASAFDDHRSPSPDTETRIEGYLEEFLQRLDSIPKGSHMVTTLMWPILIAGSCMRLSSHRRSVARFLAESPISMWSLKRIKELLFCLWDAQDVESSIYGIYGLECMMRRQCLNICVG